MNYRRRSITTFRLMIGLVAVMFATVPLMAQEIVGSASAVEAKSKSTSKSDKIPTTDEIFNALTSCDIAYFEQFFNGGMDPDTYTTDKGKTLLMAAKSVPLATLLLSNGADPTLRDEKGATALHHAVLYPDAAQIIPMLIEKGADVNVVDGKGNTPLIAAVVNDKPDLVELLLSLGAQVGEKTGDGQTALDWAEELGFVDIIELLESYQANP